MVGGDRLVRSEGPDKSTTLYDRDAHEITIINPKNRTYLKLEGSLRQPLDPKRVSRSNAAANPW